MAEVFGTAHPMDDRCEACGHLILNHNDGVVLVDGVPYSEHNCSIFRCGCSLTERPQLVLV